tara:strand:+ start:19 stop:822 length:804 start_codon:yes stop_codon:yes gene_type:complete
MKTKLLTICLLLSITLSGCYTAAKMQALTDKHVYQHVDSLVAAVGMPSEEKVIAGRRMLTWYVSTGGVMPITTPSSSTGTVYGYGGVTHVTITSSTTTYVPFNFNCKLDAHVTDGYIIKQIYWDGNIGGCEIFYNRLKKYKSDDIHEIIKDKKRMKEMDDETDKFFKKNFPETWKNRTDICKKYQKELIKELKVGIDSADISRQGRNGNTIYVETKHASNPYKTDKEFLEKYHPRVLYGKSCKASGVKFISISSMCTGPLANMECKD